MEPLTSIDLRYGRYGSRWMWTHIDTWMIAPAQCLLQVQQLAAKPSTTRRHDQPVTMIHDLSTKIWHNILLYILYIYIYIYYGKDSPHEIDIYISPYFLMTWFEEIWRKCGILCLMACFHLFPGCNKGLQEQLGWFLPDASAVYRIWAADPSEGCGFNDLSRSLHSRLGPAELMLP